MTVARRAGVRRPSAAPTESFTGQTVKFSLTSATILRLVKEMSMTATAKRRIAATALATLALGAVLIAARKPASASSVAPKPIDCAKVRPQIRVRGSVDGSIYSIDICAVADSAEGEDFRTVDSTSK